MLDAKNENLPKPSEDVKKTISEKKADTESTKEEVADISVDSDQKTEQEVVDEIENEIAESSENEEDTSVGDGMPKYEDMELEELVVHLEELLKEERIQKINNDVNSIKNSFNSKFSKLLAEKKAKFLEDGGDSIDFSYTNPNKVKFNELYTEFRDKRTKHYKNLETQLTDNLETRITLSLIHI